MTPHIIDLMLHEKYWELYINEVLFNNNLSDRGDQLSIIDYVVDQIVDDL